MSDALLRMSSLSALTPVDPRVAALLASRREGFGMPRALYLDENLDYARRLIDAGVPVELHVYPGAVHGFDLLGASRVGNDFLRDMLSGTARMLGCKDE